MRQGRRGREGNARLLALLTVPVLLLAAYLGYDYYLAAPRTASVVPTAWAANLDFQGLTPEELAFTRHERSIINRCCNRHAEQFPEIRIHIRRKHSWGTDMEPGTRLETSMQMMTPEGCEVIAADREIARQSLARRIARNVDKAADAIGRTAKDGHAAAVKHIFL